MSVDRLLHRDARKRDAVRQRHVEVLDPLEPVREVERQARQGGTEDEPAEALGNAGAADSLTVMTGRVTGLRRAITVRGDESESSHRLVGLIETSAPLLPGDSGGPLLASGRVIGVNVAGSPTSGFGGENDNYAIPINTAISIEEQIESGRGSSTVHVEASGGG